MERTPIQAKGIGDVRKVIPLGTPKEKRLVPQSFPLAPLGTPKEKRMVPPSSPLVPLGTPASGPLSGTSKGGDPGGAPKNEPPKEKKSISKPLVEVEKKPTPKVNKPEMREAITPAQRQT